MTVMTVTTRSSVQCHDTASLCEQKRFYHGRTDGQRPPFSTAEEFEFCRGILTFPQNSRNYQVINTFIGIMSDMLITVISSDSLSFYIFSRHNTSVVQMKHRFRMTNILDVSHSFQSTRVTREFHCTFEKLFSFNVANITKYNASLQ